MNEHVIDINLDGSVESLYSNEIDLGVLGDQEMERASHVVFNKKTQKWDVEPVGYDPLELPFTYRGFDTYKEAVDFEVFVFNVARKLSMLKELHEKKMVVVARDYRNRITSRTSP